MVSDLELLVLYCWLAALWPLKAISRLLGAFSGSVDSILGLDYNSCTA